jgi:dolichyl-phosphate beta-glucosyltransferase
MKPFLSIIIPAYNEAKRLPLTLADINKRLSAVDYSYEIIVVDDGSKDATVEIAKRFTHLIKNLKVIENKENHGKGWVVKQGMLQAQGKWRLFTDADNATSIDQFCKMIPYFPDYQIIIGSRDIKGAKLMPPQPFYRRFLGNVGNLIIQILLLPGLWDTQCGFKCFSEEAALKIFSLMKINRWGFDVEALALGKKLGYKIKEIPVVWVNDPSSKVKPSAYLQMLGEVFKIRWWLWVGKYKGLG